MSGEDELRATLEALRQQENPDPAALFELLRKACKHYRREVKPLHLVLEEARHLGPNLANLRLPEARELVRWGTEGKDPHAFNDVMSALVRMFHDVGGPDMAARLLLLMHATLGTEYAVLTDQAFKFLARELLKDDALGSDLRRALVEAALGTPPRDRRQITDEQLARALACIQEDRGARNSEVSRASGLSQPTIAALRREGVLPKRAS